jgi:alpha-amylase/alpha-mannosidase (GH57 family)
LKDEEEVKSYLKNLKEEDLLVFEQSYFKSQADYIIHKYEDMIPQYLVVNSKDMPATIGEKIILRLYRKLKIFKKKTTKIYERELIRITPNIEIMTVKNYSLKRIFKDIEELRRG